MDEVKARILAVARRFLAEGAPPNAVWIAIPGSVMQACLEAGDLGGTPSEVRAIEMAYAKGIERAIALLTKSDA